MKTSLSIKILAFAGTLPVPFARAATSDLPYLLEIKKATPLFARPSTKSEKLADAEEGTLLLFVEKSKKGIWVKLRDSDGLSGWMPLARTDYTEVDAARLTQERMQEVAREEAKAQRAETLAKKKSPPGKEPEAPKEKTEEEEMEKMMKEAQGPFNPRFRLAPFGRVLFDSLPASPRLGLRFDYNLENTDLRSRKSLSSAWASLEATLPAGSSGEDGGGEFDFTAAARYLLRVPVWGPFFYVQDIGYSVDKVNSDYRHHLALGLSGGVAWRRFDLTLRGGCDLFAQSRTSIDVQLGVSF